MPQKHTHTKKKVGKSIGDPVRGRDAPITSTVYTSLQVTFM